MWIFPIDKSSYNKLATYSKPSIDLGVRNGTYYAQLGWRVGTTKGSLTLG
jgi:hypothetical protein